MVEWEKMEGLACEDSRVLIKSDVDPVSKEKGYSIILPPCSTLDAAFSVLAWAQNAAMILAPPTDCLMIDWSGISSNTDAAEGLLSVCT